jgi:uncharacterized protein
MLLPAFNHDTLKNRLRKLSDEQQLAFGAACCERLLPNYLAFQTETGWGDLKTIRSALDLVWSCLCRESLSSSKEVKLLITCCESVAPNSEYFVSLYLTSAQDACFAICGLLDYLIESDVDKIVKTATYATDSVDLYVQEIENMDPNSPELEQVILTHRLMQRELSQQEKDLKFVEQAISLNSILLFQLKKSWNNNGKSNLDLP